MDKKYLLDISIQDLKQSANILHRAADRLDDIGHEKAYTLNTLIEDIESLIEELENGDE
ncbi:hypothetical protein [Staphylospora marina]|uniref:hypothetical protein n=1 Tax=Staphylospora marina TaxID=2490858 RepID=UPI0013DDDEAA|nr:hypothetical protein [Staphylospora marina]